MRDCSLVNNKGSDYSQDRRQTQHPTSAKPPGCVKTDKSTALQLRDANILSGVLAEWHTMQIAIRHSGATKPYLYRSFICSFSTNKIL